MSDAEFMIRNRSREVEAYLSNRPADLAAGETPRWTSDRTAAQVFTAEQIDAMRLQKLGAPVKVKPVLAASEVRERDADFVAQARALSNHYWCERTDKDDPRAHLTFWLAKGHKSVARIHKKTFKTANVR